MFFTCLLGEVRRRGWGVVSLAVGIACGVAVAVVVTAVGTGVERARDGVVASSYGRGTDLTVSGAPGRTVTGAARFAGGQRITVAGRGPLGAGVVAAVAGRSGVAAAAGGLTLRVTPVDGAPHRATASATAGELDGRHGYGGYGGYRGRNGTGDYRVDGVDLTAPALGPLTAATVTDGTGFTRAQADAAVAVVDTGYARRAGLRVGRTLTIGGTDFRVIATVTAAPGAAADVYLPLRQAQRLAGAQDRVTTVYVRTTPGTRAETVRTAIRRGVPGTTVTTAAGLARNVSGSLPVAAGVAEALGRWPAIVAVAAGTVLGASLTRASVGRREAELAELGVLGWPRWRIAAQVAGEAVTGGALGGVLGAALGYGAARLVQAVGPALTARPAGGHTSRVALCAPVGVPLLLAAVALAVGGGLVAGAVGAGRAVRCTG
ncbi:MULTISPECIES: ABC transporter permease [Streptomycetaceae]|uniref:ABC transporter permease n=1 Tax=Streptomycetaceae TaxID=2062 RepID=UPI001E2A5A71|nr:ABC transporter permease [Streptantibioticus cattleyicolor]